ncbi:MAG: metal-dependent hydrolase [Planctomycetota bacterium]|nr:MAG: metal-dependent hydrolase [Planctomycetota bacterium]
MLVGWVCSEKAMKGIVHFISGVAAASCFPQAVHMARDEQSFIIALGGVFGILPDTLDFKFAQFFENYTKVVDPDPENPNAQEIAQATADVINQAMETGKPTGIMFQTIKLGADLWRQYTISFEPKEVVVEIGPIVSTSKKPYLGTEPKENRIGRAPIKAPVLNTYDQKTHVNIMNGPSFEFVPRGDRVESIFIPWHRRWSHSLVLGCFIGLVMAILFGWIYGVVAAVAFNVHILEDQLGYMGSNLFWPFGKERIEGLHLMRSMDVWPNLATFWLAIALILFNVNRFSPSPSFTTDWMVYFSYAFIVPFFALYFTAKILSLATPVGQKLFEEKEEEVIEEVMDGEGA